jgi:hypothetical protein
MSAEAAAKFLGSSIRNFRRKYIDSGKLKPVVFSGRHPHHKFLVKDVEKLKQC